MNRRKWVVGGSIGAGVLLILAMLATVVNAQTVKTSEIRTNIVQHIKDKIENKLWKPGELLGLLAILFIILLTLLTGGYWGP